MRNRTITFEKVSIKDTKKIRCKKCGKSTQETEEFYQTISPFNKDEDGNEKTYAKIMEENVKKLERWRKQPLECNKC